MPHPTFARSFYFLEQLSLLAWSMNISRKQSKRKWWHNLQWFFRSSSLLLNTHLVFTFCHWSGYSWLLRINSWKVMRIYFQCYVNELNQICLNYENKATFRLIVYTKWSQKYKLVASMMTTMLSAWHMVVKRLKIGSKMETWEGYTAVARSC